MSDCRPGDWIPVPPGSLGDPYSNPDKNVFEVPDVGPWIPCSRRMPPEGSKDLLVCWQGTSRHEHADFVVGLWHVDGGLWHSYPTIDPDDDSAPTHWCLVQVPE